MAAFYHNGFSGNSRDVAREDQTSSDKLKNGRTPPCNEKDYVRSNWWGVKFCVLDENNRRVHIFPRWAATRNIEGLTSSRLVLAQARPRRHTNVLFTSIMNYECVCSVGITAFFLWMKQVLI